MPNYSESLPELFKRVSKAKTNDEKKRMLREKDSKHLKTVLQGAFHPDIVWALPEGSAPYKKYDSPYGLAPSVLEREIRKFPYFVSGVFGGKLIQNKIRREEIFVQMLESIHPSESELIVQMKDKNIKVQQIGNKKRLANDKENVYVIYIYIYIYFDSIFYIAK